MESLVMKKHLPQVLIVLILIAGLSLLLYPTVSDYINSLNHRNAISEYTSTVESIPIENREELLTAALKYNEELAAIGTGSLVNLSDDRRALYNSLLNVSGNGIMGYINIPAINVSLPIYHSVEDTVLQVGIGHLEGSSLPVGGESAHSVLSGHTGLPSATLFTNIDRLVPGDIFTIHILGETFTYEVDQIETVLPNELNALSIEDGKDYCTLVTCTPYGINTHRLLVRGHRIENLPEKVESVAELVHTICTPIPVYIIVAVAEIPVLPIFFIIFIIRKIKQKSGKNDEIMEGSL